jgi:branched-chain amino acid aminotransferase
MPDDLFLSLNDQMMPESAARISPFDRGFLWGDGVYEVTPCYDGELFRLDDHLDRLYRSLRYVQIDPGIPWQEIKQATLRLHDLNADRIEPGGIYRVGHWITRGEDALSMSAIDAGPATVLIFYRPVDLAPLIRNQEEGVRLSVVATRRNPPSSLEARAKVTSKMNQVLAELDAASRGALSLMLDVDGNVAENATANLFIVRDGALWTAPARNVLEGVTRKVVLELAGRLGLPIKDRPFTLYDVAQASELFLTASTRGVVPVREVDRFTPPSPVPGPITRRLTAAYAEECGYDVKAAAARRGRPVAANPDGAARD